MLTHEKMRDAVIQYARYLSDRNVDGILSLFSPEGVLEDPVGQPARVGHAEMRKFFEAGFDTVNGEMHMRIEGEVRVAERHAACAMVVDCPKADEPFWIATLDVFTFNDDALFSGMQAFWGASNFHPLNGQPAQSA